MADTDPTELEKIPGIGPKRATALSVAGYETLDDLEAASEADLRTVEGIDDVLARDIKATVSPSDEGPVAVKQLNHITPENWTVTDQQVAHIRSLVDDAPLELAGSTALDIRDELEWVLDPDLLGFRRVCGRVVTYDEATGEYHPVPNATVHVEDTDCSFLSYFPERLGYGWFFPYGCTREEIATTTTDECGRFCVWVPRWDIDRVLRVRRERVCLPEIVRPRLRDILENPRVFPEPVFPPEPRPRPDPAPIDLFDPGVYERTRELVGSRTVNRLDARMETHAFGEPTEGVEALLSKPAFPRPPDPPLPEGFRGLEPGARPDGIDELPVDPGVFERVDFADAIGPFLRCRDVFVPEWQTFVDIPDITFRVTQDVDGDGTKETIYSEGFFAVRWDDHGSIDVDLVASEDALSIPTCDGLTPENVECETPSIESIGVMPARLPQFDTSTGYAPGVNRPKPPSGPRGDAEAPLAKTLQLHGCHRFEEAEYYRVLYRYEGETERPFTGHEWHVPAIGRDPVHVQPANADGWYPILDIPELESYYGESLGDNPLVFPYWLLNWNTRGYRDGTYELQVELADGSFNALDERSPTYTLEVDNRRPHLSIDSLVWGPFDEPASTWDNTLDTTCPRIERDAGTDIGVKLAFTAWGEHFRSVTVSAHGCDANPVLTTPSAPSTNEYDYWHQSVGDTSHTQTLEFKIPKSHSEGVYRLHLKAVSRAFNPAGAGSGPSSNWEFDRNEIDREFTRVFSITDV